MSDIIDPLVQVRALQELASKLPPGSMSESTLFWENDHGVAGVTIGNDKCVVFLFDAEQTIGSLTEAGEVLRAILADEIAAVRAYAKEVFVYCGLAPTKDPSAGFSRLGKGESRSRTMPDIDYVAIATWSRGYLEDPE